MKKTTTIGIVGGYGMTGEIVARELINEKDVVLFIAGRDQNKAQNLAGELGPNARAFKLDLDNQGDLDDFCQQSDIIINCTGPSIVYGERTALSALKHNCHYIDPGGYEYLMNILTGYTEEIKQKGLFYLLSCGWIPGIAEVFVHYAHTVALQHMDTLETLEHFFGDRNEWSENGLQDILWHVRQTDKPGKGMGSYERGRWKSLAFGQPFQQEVALPPPFGKQKAYLNFPNELTNFARKNRDYKKITGYSIQVSFKTMMAMLIIRTFYKNNTTKALQCLKKAFAKDCRENGRGGGVVVRIQGSKAGIKQLLTGSFFINKPYWMTAIAPVIATRMILKNEVKHPDCNYLCDMVEPSVFMDLLAQAGLQYEFRLNYTKIALKEETQ